MTHGILTLIIVAFRQTTRAWTATRGWLLALTNRCSLTAASAAATVPVRPIGPTGFADFAEGAD